MDAQDIIRRFEQVRGERGVWEQHWQEISDYVLPRRGAFAGGSGGHPAGLSSGQAGGAKRTERIFDGTAPWALEQLAS